VQPDRSTPTKLASDTYLKMGHSTHGTPPSFVLLQLYLFFFCAIAHFKIRVWFPKFIGSYVWGGSKLYLSTQCELWLWASEKKSWSSFSCIIFIHIYKSIRNRNDWKVLLKNKILLIRQFLTWHKNRLKAGILMCPQKCSCLYESQCHRLKRTHLCCNSIPSNKTQRNEMQ
jgi:hypothetical protein